MTKKQKTLKPRKYHVLKILALVLVGVCVMTSQLFTTNAITFAAISLFAAPSAASFSSGTFKLFKIDVTSLVQGLLKTQFNRSLMTKSFKSCGEISAACEHEYQACVGLIDQFDQGGNELLLKAKNNCIYSCAGTPDNCFGLSIKNKKVQIPTASTLEPSKGQAALECTGPTTASCQTATGLFGTQTATDCDTATGQWNFGPCIANPVATCTSFTYSAWGACVNGIQTRTVLTSSPAGCTGGNPVLSQACTVPCQGREPTCPAGYSGTYTCQNGQWVNGCQSPGACTSFTYSPWTTCVNGQQTRTVLTSSPAGCTGGNPVLSQACTVPCQGNAPVCPIGYTGNYTCQNGQWVNGCVLACQARKPDCPANWTGSYTCSPYSGNWVNTCSPVAATSCYKGVLYAVTTFGSPDCPTCRAFAKCVGLGQVINGKNSYLNDCGFYQPWTNFSNENSFKRYVDTIYNNIPNSYNPNFKYTQCR